MNCCLYVGTKDENKNDDGDGSVGGSSSGGSDGDSDSKTLVSLITRIRLLPTVYPHVDL